MTCHPALLDQPLREPGAGYDNRVVARRALDLANRPGHRHRRRVRTRLDLDLLEPRPPQPVDFREVGGRSVDGRPAALAERGEKVGQACPGVPDKPDLGRVVLADLTRIDVELD